MSFLPPDLPISWMLFIASIAIGAFILAPSLRRVMNSPPTETTPITMSKWVPISDQLLLRRMGKTGEECAELLAVTNRIIIQGIDEIDPSSGKTNRQRLIEETADVYAQLDSNMKMLCLPWEITTERRHRKARYMDQWEAMFQDGPGEEDGPWAEGWEKRNGQQ